MRTYFLAVPIMVTAAFLQACTGGRLEDANGDALPGIANTYTQYTVQFQDLSNGSVLTTGVDSNGLFGFDPYAPGSASNNSVALVPGDSYQISVLMNNGYAYTTPYAVTQTYDNQGCKDTLTGQQDKYCMVYRLQLLTPVNNFTVVPSPPVTSGLFTTVQLAGPVEPVTITYSQLGACNGTEWEPPGNDGPAPADATADYAQVAFKIANINNPGADAFAFDPTKLYVQTPAGQFHFNPSMQIYSYLFIKFAAVATTIPPMSLYGINGYGATSVYANNPDPSAVADDTSYSLGYAGGVGDPPVVFVKSNASQTSWAHTQNCLRAEPGVNDGLDPSGPALSDFLQ
jgi:hypothetical protein